MAAFVTLKHKSEHASESDNFLTDFKRQILTEISTNT